MAKNFPDTIMTKKVPGDNVAIVETPMPMQKRMQRSAECIQIINAGGVKTF